MQTNVRTLKNSEGTSCRQYFWLMMAIFYALFVVRNVFSVQFPVMLYLIWVAVMAFTFNDTEIKALIVSFIPLVPGFQGMYALLICMVAILVKYGKRLTIPLFVLLLPILMMWELLHMWGDGYSSMAEYLSSFAPLMCLVVIICMPSKKEDSTFFVRVLAISSVVAFCILLASTVLTSGVSLLTLIQEGFRLGSVEVLEVGHKITYNANGLGFLCNLSIAGLLTNVYFKKANRMDYGMIAFLAVVGCLTVSRTFLLCLAGIAVLYILLQKKSLQHKIKTFMLIGVTIAAAFVVMKLVLPSVIDNYIARFSAEDVTGGRSGLYDFYNQFIHSSPERFWYGIGVQCIPEKIWDLQKVEIYSPHNGYQQLMVAWGVIGLVLILAFLVCMVLYARKRNPRSPMIVLLPFILLLVTLLGGQFITSGTMLLSLVFIYLLICSSREKGLA